MKITRTLALLLATAPLLAAACGSTIETASSAGTGTGGTGTGGTGSGGTGSGSTGSGSTGSGGKGTGGTGTTLPPGDCRSTADCTGSFETDQCIAPGAFAGCGICENPVMTCTADADCAAKGATFICALPLCSCMGKMTCLAGCTADAACSTGETCAPSHHCVPAACTSDGDCPANFGCSASTCQRKTCTTDATCAGYCVTGACYDALGTCTPPVA